MSATTPPDRCRLVLATPDEAEIEELARRLADALEAGDVASVILTGEGPDEKAMQRRAERLAEIAQPRGVALVLAGEPRLATRAGADGVHFELPPGELDDLVRSMDGRLMVGAGGARTRHEALGLGEARPDYLFFGRFGRDTAPDPHPRNLALARWWAELVEIPCLAQGGSDVGSVVAVAATGAEFVVLSAAVFGEGADAAARVAEANALLDAEAPRLRGAR